MYRILSAMEILRNRSTAPSEGDHVELSGTVFNSLCREMNEGTMVQRISMHRD